MIKIKAFENIDKCYKGDIQRIEQGIFSKYCLLKVVINDNLIEVRYTKDGSQGLLFKKAKDMLKVLDIELYQEKEINSLDELINFIVDNNVTMTKFDEEIWFATLDDEGNLYSCWFDVLHAEEKYNVKLNILRGE